MHRFIAEKRMLTGGMLGCLFLFLCLVVYAVALYRGLSLPGAYLIPALYAAAGYLSAAHGTRGIERLLLPKCLLGAMLPYLPAILVALCRQEAAPIQWDCALRCALATAAGGMLCAILPPAGNRRRTRQHGKIHETAKKRRKMKS